MNRDTPNKENNFQGFLAVEPPTAEAEKCFISVSRLYNPRRQSRRPMYRTRRCTSRSPVKALREREMSIHPLCFRLSNLSSAMRHGAVPIRGSSTRPRTGSHTRPRTSRCCSRRATNRGRRRDSVQGVIAFSQARRRSRIHHCLRRTGYTDQIVRFRLAIPAPFSCNLRTC